MNRDAVDCDVSFGARGRASQGQGAGEVETWAGRRGTELMRIEGEEEIHAQKNVKNWNINALNSVNGRMCVGMRCGVMSVVWDDQKSSLRWMGRMSSRVCLSAMNLALAFLGSVWYWKYWQRQKSLVWTTICFSLRSIWMSFMAAPGSWMRQVTSWQQLEEGSLPLSPRYTSCVPTTCRYSDSNSGCFRGSCLITGSSATSSSLQIWCRGSVLGLAGSASFLGFGWYFSPILASILALGAATSFFSGWLPISPGLSMLPLQGFSTMSGSSSPAISSFSAIIDPQSNIQPINQFKQRSSHQLVFLRLRTILPLLVLPLFVLLLLLLLLLLVLGVGRAVEQDLDVGGDALEVEDVGQEVVVERLDWVLGIVCLHVLFLNRALLAALEETEVSAAAHRHSSLRRHQDGLGRHLHALGRMLLPPQHPQVAPGDLSPVPEHQLMVAKAGHKGGLRGQQPHRLHLLAAAQVPERQVPHQSSGAQQIFIHGIAAPDGSGVQEGVGGFCSGEVDEVDEAVVAAADHAGAVHSPQLVHEVLVDLGEESEGLCLVVGLGDVPDGDVARVVAVGQPALAHLQQVVDVHLVPRLRIQPQLHLPLLALLKPQLLPLNHAVLEPCEDELAVVDMEAVDGLHFVLEVKGDGERGECEVVEVDAARAREMEHEGVLGELPEFEERVVEEGVALGEPPPALRHIIHQSTHPCPIDQAIRSVGARPQQGSHALDEAEQVGHLDLLGALLLGQFAGVDGEVLELLLAVDHGAGLLELLDEAEGAEGDEVGLEGLEGVGVGAVLGLALLALALPLPHAALVGPPVLPELDLRVLAVDRRLAPRALPPQLRALPPELHAPPLAHIIPTHTPIHPPAHPTPIHPYTQPPSHPYSRPMYGEAHTPTPKTTSHTSHRGGQSSVNPPIRRVVEKGDDCRLDIPQLLGCCWGLQVWASQRLLQYQPMSAVGKYVEEVDKENTKAGVPPPKQGKGEEQVIKKTVLGETNQPKIIPPEPSSPEDSKLLDRKRQMNRQSVQAFAFKLHCC